MAVGISDPWRDGVAALATALRARRPALPDATFIVGVTGAVSSGKSALVEALRDPVADWAGHPLVETVSTDGFLFPNAVLDARGLTLRKGFPESFDAAAMRQALAAVRLGPVSFPGYSHLTYDVDPALSLRIDRPGVLLVEGVGLDAALGELDVLVFVDATEAALEAWFVARFLGLWEAGRSDPAAFYARFAALDQEGAEALARTVWREINLPNLREHIAPLRERADIVVTKGPDHAIAAVTVTGKPAQGPSQRP